MNIQEVECRINSARVDLKNAEEHEEGARRAAVQTDDEQSQAFWSRQIEFWVGQRSFWTKQIRFWTSRANRIELYG